jgi:arginine transport system substrate-binding protein
MSFNKFFKISSIMFLGLAFLFLLWAQNKDEKGDRQSLTVGLESTYPPYEFIDASGQLVGFDVDFASQIAKKLNKKLVIKQMEFEALILALQQHKVDLILSGMTITPSRQKEILMVPYYGENIKSNSLIFWGLIPENIQTIQDISTLPNKTIAVQAGSIQEQYLQGFSSIQIKSLDGVLQSLLDVKYGKSIAAFISEEVAGHLKTKYPEIQVLEVPIGPEDNMYGVGVGINKDNPELAQTVASIIAELKADESLKDLIQKWFKE